MYSVTDRDPILLVVHVVSHVRLFAKTEKSQSAVKLHSVLVYGLL